MINYVALDVETTGLEPGSRLIQVGAVHFTDAGDVISTFEENINPIMPLPPDAAEVNHIKPEILALARTASEVLTDFMAWLPENPIFVAHWAQFDTGMIAWQADYSGIVYPKDAPVICTCKLAKMIGETKSNGLAALEQHYQLQRNGTAHTALSDADVCRQYFMLRGNKQAIMQSPWHAAGHNYSYLSTEQLPPALQDIYNLVNMGSPLTFRYSDAKDEITERTITPYGWAVVKDVPMFHGFCHLRQERRTFRVDRVQEVV